MIRQTLKIGAVAFLMLLPTFAVVGCSHNSDDPANSSANAGKPVAAPVAAGSDPRAQQFAAQHATGAAADGQRRAAAMAALSKNSH